ncbi:MAG: glycosyltransferase family 4 protein [Candidatus Geothermincolia bacterium]
MPTRIALVPPRYGEGVVGGAETLVREQAEELARRGWDVEILTTCVLDHYTWANYYPEGEDVVRGIRVRRFPAVTNMHDPQVRAYHEKVLSGEPLAREKQIHWISNTVSSPKLLSYIKEKADEYRAFVFAPYLFGTTYLGAMTVPEKAFVISCLHDESYARLPIFKEMLHAVRGVMFNTVPEQELARRLMGDEIRGRVVGMGFTRQPSHGERFRHKYGLPGDFILYMGRREPGKNTHVLLQHFCNYLHHTGRRDLKLVLTGTGTVEIPYRFRESVIDLGFISERDKWDSYTAARLLCQPSVNESLSIVMLQAWLWSLPALVHRDCAVTRDHVVRSGGGLYFGTYPQFSEALDVMLRDSAVATRMGEGGRAYVEREFSWDRVVESFALALEEGGV